MSSSENPTPDGEKIKAMALVDMEWINTQALKVMADFNEHAQPAKDSGDEMRLAIVKVEGELVAFTIALSVLRQSTRPAQHAFITNMIHALQLCECQNKEDPAHQHIPAVH